MHQGADSVVPSDCCVADLEDYEFFFLVSVVDIYLRACELNSEKKRRAKL